MVLTKSGGSGSGSSNAADKMDEYRADNKDEYGDSREKDKQNKNFELPDAPINELWDKKHSLVKT